MVLAKPGWFAFVESARSRRIGHSGARTHRRSENTSEAQVMRVYECPPEACDGNNVCLGKNESGDAREHTEHTHIQIPRTLEHIPRITQ